MALVVYQGPNNNETFVTGTDERKLFVGLVNNYFILATLY